MKRIIGLLLCLCCFAPAIARPRLPKTLLSVKLREADASTFFRAVVEKVGANLVVADCADQKSINLEIRNAPLDEVVNLVARQYQLKVTYDGSTIEVGCY
jgi:type II secretory pathway component GspD/PulD (secretin)